MTKTRMKLKEHRIGITMRMETLKSVSTQRIKESMCNRIKDLTRMSRGLWCCGLVDWYGASSASLQPSAPQPHLRHNYMTTSSLCPTFFSPPGSRVAVCPFCVAVFISIARAIGLEYGERGQILRGEVKWYWILWFGYSVARSEKST